jgi:signal transduction histidine kinase
VQVVLRVVQTYAGDKAELLVGDNGPGIDPEHREYVLERFYRLEDSRSTPGSGLGLSLVAAVAEFHDAVLELGDNNPGLMVCLRFDAFSPAADLPADLAGEAAE